MDNTGNLPSESRKNSQGLAPIPALGSTYGKPIWQPSVWSGKWFFPRDS